MSIDERLDRLTERHDALSQTTELLAAHLHELDEKLRNLTGNVDELSLGALRLLDVALRMRAGAYPSNNAIGSAP